MPVADVGELELLKAFRADIEAAAPREGEPDTNWNPDPGRPPRKRADRRRLMVVLVAVVAVVLVGAGVLAGFQVFGKGRGEQVKVTGLPPTPAPPPTPVAGPVDFVSGWTFSSVNPVADFLGTYEGGGLLTAAEEQNVAACMQAKGWAFQPTVNTLTGNYGAGGGPDNPVALLQYRENYGYGYLVQTPAEQLPGPVYNQLDGKTATEANADYVQSLPVAERARYVSDYGSVGSAFGEGSGKPSGCLGAQAVSQAGVDPPLPAKANQELVALSRQIDADPAMVAANKAWSSCMAGRGFHFTQEDQAQSSISKYFGDEMAGTPTPLPGLATKQAQELQTATADAKCAVATVWPVQSRLGYAAVHKVIEKFGASQICGESKCVVDPP